MPAAAVSGSMKTKRRSCFSFCFSSSAVYDPDDSQSLRPEKAPGRSPEAFFLARVCRQNKTVPLLEEITADREGHMAEGGEIKREVPLSVISPAAYCYKGVPEKIRKVEKRLKLTGTKPLTHKTLLSTCSNKRSNNQQSSINHPPSATLHKVNRHGPVQSRTRNKMSQLSSPDPTRPISSIQSHPGLDMLVGLKMVAMMLAMILIGGKIFAVVITTLCFYFLSCVGQSPLLMRLT